MGEDKGLVKVEAAEESEDTTRHARRLDVFSRSRLASTTDMPLPCIFSSSATTRRQQWPYDHFTREGNTCIPEFPPSHSARIFRSVREGRIHRLVRVFLAGRPQ